MNLKELLGEKLFVDLMAKLGEKHKLAIVSDGSYIPKDKFNKVNIARKAAENALKERDKQIHELKKSVDDNEALKAHIDKLQLENKMAKDKYEADMKELLTGTAIKLALYGKVHDPDIVASLLAESNIEINDTGAVKGGLEDQLKVLLTSKAFLLKLMW